MNRRHEEPLRNFVHVTCVANGSSVNISFTDVLRNLFQGFIVISIVHSLAVQKCMMASASVVVISLDEWL